jgi:hypothetical protein
VGPQSRTMCSEYLCSPHCGADDYRTRIWMCLCRYVRPIHQHRGITFNDQEPQKSVCRRMRTDSPPWVLRRNGGADGISIGCLDSFLERLWNVVPHKPVQCCLESIKSDSDTHWSRIYRAFLLVSGIATLASMLDHLPTVVFYRLLILKKPA